MSQAIGLQELHQNVKKAFDIYIIITAILSSSSVPLMIMQIKWSGTADLNMNMYEPSSNSIHGYFTNGDLH